MLAFLGAVVFVLVSSVIVLNLMSNVQHEPYMDEIFHIPQAQQYCAYNFSSWDPMITTLPGLYISAVALLQPIASLRNVALHEICTNFNLRIINLVFSSGNFILLFLLSKKLHKNTKVPKHSWDCDVLNAFVLVMFPILHFFTWLFYTDQGSTFCTLFMYLCCLHGQHSIASLAGIAAVLFRQTNVIWVVFCLGLTKAQVLEDQLRLDKKKVKNFVIFIVMNPIKVLTFTAAAWYLIRSFTYEHVYLLSDNRHYTFYFWSKIYKRHEFARYALIPVYLYSLYQFYCLTHARGLLWRICFAICVLASLVPHSLLEFRYFIIPFYILRLNMQRPCMKLLVVELLFYVCINAAAIFMFTQRPFHWPDSSSAQRFMW
ncbi:Dol-p-glc:glc(2)man(9)glcnac(2)-pp-dol alpha-1,2-glucosyltransferase [Plakobranchus ocellatus]|uniref:Dol-P-Glc:Glc(2)Man(9)GlcNAc(2)-PP-Dol alpha-1,2-glucosyltransferase n=1 Tax=Plakobranchus ocellatus TaxID=259542 RepID=A0AAV4DF54_9GAST|nr:Dol-p-glc:glc(2)man(9)glcnac(2)-pp-dol alpha-1,2-glucosyltransferase [Plakobranchus ocellatus]